MSYNTFGRLFRVTTFGESHGPAIGAVVDGCPAGIPITREEIDLALQKRRPGRSAYTSPRQEADEVEILSGIFEGQTTGAPIALLIRNIDANSKSYEPIKDLLRPGHANFTYLEKYGVFDYRGGGRSSARETAARVAAGAIAEKMLRLSGIEIGAFLAELGGVAIAPMSDCSLAREQSLHSPIFCPDSGAEAAMKELLDQVRGEGDSVGGIVQGFALGLPPGIGDPVYGKLEALLASAMLSLPASKGFEIGDGFQAARMRGSTHNDLFGLDDEGRPPLRSNHAGGTLGGISTGMPLTFRVAFKPPSSIQKTQETLSVAGAPAAFALPAGSRHDPCVAIRAVPVVQAMMALVLADGLLAGRTSKYVTKNKDVAILKK